MDSEKDVMDAGTRGRTEQENLKPIEAALEIEDKANDSRSLKLDKHGLPLVPQPTDNKDDPLNWSPILKLLVTLQVSWLAFLGPLGSAVVNPAYVTLGKAFHIGTVPASYSLTVYIICGGIGPILVVPLSNVYGRRPIYIVGTLLAGVTNIAAGYCTTWSGILATRAFNGLGAGSGVAIGAATICDIYYMHERGFYMGIWTWFLTNGAHVAPLIGGFIAQDIGWRWCYIIPGYVQIGTFVILLFCLPETLYSRKASNVNHVPHSYADLLLFRNTRLHDRRLHVSDFFRPFYMLRYVSVLFPCLYYMTCFGYGSVLFATTGSNLFHRFYKFDLAQTGLLLSIPLLIGCLIGEANAGWFTDWMVYRYARHHDGVRKPEPRLDALWVALLVPIGVIIEGVCLTHYKTASWVGSAFGMGIACLGLQVATTVVYTYCTDCYKPQSSEISSMLNVFRQVFSALVAFYAIPLGEAIKYEYAWLVFAIINVVTLLPMFVLRIKGSEWRACAWQKPPTFHNDI